VNKNGTPKENIPYAITNKVISLRALQALYRFSQNYSAALLKYML